MRSLQSKSRSKHLNFHVVCIHCGKNSLCYIIKPFLFPSLLTWKFLVSFYPQQEKTILNLILWYSIKIYMWFESKWGPGFHPFGNQSGGLARKETTCGILHVPLPTWSNSIGFTRGRSRASYRFQSIYTRGKTAGMLIGFWERCQSKSHIGSLDKKCLIYKEMSDSN